MKIANAMRGEKMGTDKKNVQEQKKWRFLEEKNTEVHSITIHPIEEQFRRLSGKVG